MEGNRDKIGARKSRMGRQREYIRPWLGLRLNVEINVTSNPPLAYTAQMERPLSSYHQLHTHTHCALPLTLEQLALWWLRACEMSFCQVN